MTQKEVPVSISPPEDRRTANPEPEEVTAIKQRALSYLKRELNSGTSELGRFTVESIKAAVGPVRASQLDVALKKLIEEDAAVFSRQLEVTVYLPTTELAERTLARFQGATVRAIPHALSAALGIALTFALVMQADLGPTVNLEATNAEIVQEVLTFGLLIALGGLGAGAAIHRFLNWVLRRQLQSDEQWQAAMGVARATFWITIVFGIAYVFSVAYTPIDFQWGAIGGVFALGFTSALGWHALQGAKK